MKLTMPAGELVAKVDAEPPRMAWTESVMPSARTNWSAVPKEMSPTRITGRPSSWSCR
jgi:hypothetical protein